MSGRGDGEQRGLQPPHARVTQAGIRTGDQLGPGWRRMAARLGLSDTSAVTVIADGAKRIWGLAAAHRPGASGVPDIHHSTEDLWGVARAVLGAGAAGCRE